MNTIILIKLIAAHLLGDFVLQSDTMCTDKFSKDSSAKRESARQPCFLSCRCKNIKIFI